MEAGTPGVPAPPSSTSLRDSFPGDRTAIPDLNKSYHVTYGYFKCPVRFWEGSTAVSLRKRTEKPCLYGVSKVTLTDAK